MGNSECIISLPQGGGAIQGIGESFSPDLFTGTGNFTVPIVLPSGRNDFHPQLNLQYSTGNGNDVFGLGWQLSTPGVVRKTSAGIPRYQDTEDVFVLSGAEDLVPVGGDLPGVVRYRPRTEGLFARIEYHREGENSFWVAQSKDGLLSTYGTENSLGNDQAVISDPNEPTHIFAWKLTETRDPFGNRIRYEYEREASGQLYLRRIRYVDFDGPEPGSEAFLVSVEFIYEDRPDPFSSHRAGFTIRTTRRCNRIEVRTHADTSQRLRTYQLVYVDQRVAPSDAGPVAIGDVPVEPLDQADLPLNGVSLLSQIHVIGHDDSAPIPADRIQRLPPLEFGYSRFRLTRRDLIPLSGRDLPSQALSASELELVDLFGGGLPDFIEMNGAVRYWRNLGGGRFDLPRLMNEAPAGVSFADNGVQLIDANGDGRTDLLVTTPELSGYYPLRFGGYWDQRSFQRYSVAPSFDLKSEDVQLVDLNGDGVTDAIRSDNRLECYFNEPHEGWVETRRVERRPLAEFPNVHFTDRRVRWADMSGDGLDDIVMVHDGNIEYWPNLGHGDWGERVHMSNSPRLPFDYDPRQVLIGDVDGDGAADLVFVDHGKIVLWINQSGNGWSDPIEIDGTPGFTNEDDVRLVDLLGTGVSGILWSHSPLAHRRERGFFHDFTRGVKPYLLTRMDNHRGSITEVNYRSSTEEYLRDQTRPETRWKTTLPFPVQVVSRVASIDEFSRGRLTTEYRYHHGYWDGSEREFRGFGYVEALNSETFADYYAPGVHNDSFDHVGEVHFSPPTLTKSWFHLGPVGDEFGEWEAVDHANEYWSGDQPFFAEERNELQEFLGGLEQRRDRRDALRTLRGTSLRTEVYALDDSPRADRPYTVTESVFAVREIDPPQDPADSRRRIFFPHLRTERTTQWERGDDPLTQVNYAGDYDEYGQSRQQLEIACPRGWREFENDSRPGSDYLTTYIETRFAQRDDDLFMVDRVSQASSFQIFPPPNEPVASVTISQLQAQAFDGSAPRELIGQAFNYFDGEAFVGLPLGQLGQFGSLVRTETLVTTEAILAEAYQGDEPNAPLVIPPYLNPSGEVSWPDEYPERFRQATPALAGYHFHEGDAEHARGYFVDAIRNRLDFQSQGVTGRGVLLAKRDPLRHVSIIDYDQFNFLVTRFTNPSGLAVTARNDYRVLQPDLITDQNGNRTAVTFSPLGLPTAIAIMGRETEPAVGDSSQTPGTRYEYDLLAYDRSTPTNRQPLSVRTIKRIHHINEVDDVITDPDETIESVEYSDGFGRMLQTRAEVEQVLFGDVVFGNDTLPPDQEDSSATSAALVGRSHEPVGPPNVVVGGWQSYDNKGLVIQEFEPFFDVGWEYRSRADAEHQRDAGEGNLFGQRVIQFYDPRGRVVRTVNADGSEQRAIYGVPQELADPNTFEPTPWEVYIYDANDLAPLSQSPDLESLTDRAPATHHFTPSHCEMDALGRTIRSIHLNGTDPEDAVENVSTYDIRDNLLSITDAMGREASRYTYDFANKAVRVISIDAGTKRTVFNALGNGIEERDSKGAAVFSTYDVLDRDVDVWARDESSQSITLRQHLVYGDQASEIDISESQARERNSIGRLIAHYDDAGLILVGRYDFKGNLVEKTRTLIRDEEILTVFEGAEDNDWRIDAYQVDWARGGASIQARAIAILDPREYTTSTRYDALNRAREIRYPLDVDGERRLLRPRYNHAGALESLILDDQVYVDHVAYNAKGQRTLVAHGNGVMTRYAYDLRNFRLIRLRSEQYSGPADFTYQPVGPPLQDFAYEYDLAGNITTIFDRTSASGVPNTLLGTDALDREFTYDPIYRLLSATGRECDTRPQLPPWFDEPRCSDITRTRTYTQRYQYDEADNLLSLHHQNGIGGFNREFSVAAGNNRLETLTVGQTVLAYTYDTNGNLTRETSSRHFEWDYADRMKTFSIQTDGAEPSVYAHYFYDATGTRVKKLVRRQGGQLMATAFIDNLVEHHTTFTNGVARENDTLHVLDDQRRIATFRAGAQLPDDTTPPVQFHLGDHLDNSNVILDHAGQLVNREEFTPFGETSFGGFARKRYRFSAKLRDEESGMNYYGARYYASWLARWTAADPAELVDGPNLYGFVSQNPIKIQDREGTNGEVFQKGQIITGEQWESVVAGDARVQSEMVAMKLRGGRGEHLIVPLSALHLMPFSPGDAQHQVYVFVSKRWEEKYDSASEKATQARKDAEAAAKIASVGPVIEMLATIELSILFPAFGRVALALGVDDAVKRGDYKAAGEMLVEAALGRLIPLRKPPARGGGLGLGKGRPPKPSVSKGASAEYLPMGHGPSGTAGRHRARSSEKRLRLEKGGPGNVAVAEIPLRPGVKLRVSAANTPKGPHAEVNLTNKLARRGIDPDRVTAYYSDYSFCLRCNSLVTSTFTRARLFYNTPYTSFSGDRSLFNYLANYRRQTLGSRISNFLSLK